MQARPWLPEALSVPPSAPGKLLPSFLGQAIVPLHCLCPPRPPVLPWKGQDLPAGREDLPHYTDSRRWLKAEMKVNKSFPRKRWWSRLPGPCPGGVPSSEPPRRSPRPRCAVAPGLGAQASFPLTIKAHIRSLHSISSPGGQMCLD